jgi:hypothetical protein
MLRLVVGGRRGEEGGQGRLELGLGVGLATRRVEEARAVDQADLALPEQARTIVAEIEPLPARRQPLGPGPRDQLLPIIDRPRPRLATDGGPGRDDGRDDLPGVPPPGAGGRRSLRLR